MKKILEVLLYGDNDIRFNTDIDQAHLGQLIPQLTSDVTMSMLTRLWGGNETAVLAMIRVLAIADLAVSINRKQMLRYLDESSLAMVRAIQEAKREFEKSGGKIIDFAPGVMPPKMKS